MRQHPELAVRFIRRHLGLDFRATTNASALQDRAYCLNLCELYVQECRKYTDAGTDYLEVSFEEILAEPALWAERLADFARVTPSLAHLAQATQLVRDDSGSTRKERAKTLA